MACRQARRHSIPGGPRRNGCDGLESLGLLAWIGNALHACTCVDGCLTGSSWSILYGKGQVDAGRDTGPQLVADAARQFENGATLGCRAQVRLVGDAFLVEGQDICYYRPGIQQSDGKVVVAV